MNNTNTKKQFMLFNYAWRENSISINDKFFQSNEYEYIIQPLEEYQQIYAQSQIYSEQVSVEGQITFVCGKLPQESIIVEIIKVKANGLNQLDPHTLLLLHAEDFNDSSAYNVPITNNGVVVSSAKSRFGGKSFYFEGVTQHLEFPQNSVIYGTNDFTVEWWEYPIRERGTRYNTSTLKGQAVSNARGMILSCTGGSFILSETGKQDLTVPNAYNQTLLNQWTHWATVRKDGVITIYKNGIKYKTFNFPQAPYQSNISVNQTIGCHIVGNANSVFKGYMDEFRISNVARWTSDFTPPTEPYK